MKISQKIHIVFERAWLRVDCLQVLKLKLFFGTRKNPAEY